MSEKSSKQLEQENARLKRQLEAERKKRERAERGRMPDKKVGLEKAREFAEERGFKWNDPHTKS